MPSPHLLTARRFYEEMWSEPNFAAADEIIHPDYAPVWVHIPKKGPEQLKHEIRYFRTMFPDLKYEVTDIIGEGDKVWARYRGTGTHEGAGWGFEATHKAAEFEGVGIFTFTANGQIIDRWASYSFYDIFTSLGLAPPWWELSRHLKR
jgi:hypothetical protein